LQVSKDGKLDALFRCHKSFLPSEFRLTVRYYENNGGDIDNFPIHLSTAPTLKRNFYEMAISEKRNSSNVDRATVHLVFNEHLIQTYSENTKPHNIKLVQLPELAPNIAQQHKTDEEILEEYLKQDESELLEFKSPMLWNKKNQTCASDNFLRLNILKAITSLLNSKGGTVLVGIDPGKKVVGLENDFLCIKNHKNWDGWQQCLVSLIKSHLGKDLFNFISITPRMKGAKTVADIKIKRSARPIWINYHDENGNKKIEFYIRTGNSRELLEGEDQHKYIKDHWGEGSNTILS
jgi:hypothetical protein